MIKIVITAVVDKTYFNVDFGDYAGGQVPLSKFFWADDILEVDLFSNRVVVELKETKADEWSVSFDELTPGALKVDSVLGVTPTTNDHLHTLIANLKG